MLFVVLLLPSCAALQGLAEVLAVMGAAHLSELLPELAASATSKNPFVREGHLTLFRWGAAERV